MAGLRRLGLDVDHVPIDPSVMPPAAAQGAIAIQVRSGDDARSRAVAAACAALNCADSAAERRPSARCWAIWTATPHPDRGKRAYG